MFGRLVDLLFFWLVGWVVAWSRVGAFVWWDGCAFGRLVVSLNRWWSCCLAFGWAVVWVFSCPVGLLIGWREWRSFGLWFISCLVGYSVDRVVCWFVPSLLGCLGSWSMVDELFGWFLDRSVGRLVDWLIGWLVGRLFDLNGWICVWLIPSFVGLFVCLFVCLVFCWLLGLWLNDCLVVKV